MLLSASIEVSGASFPVIIRDLTTGGALIEAEELLVEGTEIIFYKGKLAVSGRVAWVHGKHAGLAFAEPLSPKIMLRYIPAASPRILADFRRPGFRGQALKTDEIQFAERYVA